FLVDDGVETVAPCGLVISLSCGEQRLIRRMGAEDHHYPGAGFIRFPTRGGVSWLVALPV
ncbi:hypothetical protein ACYT7O_10190, partial [Streptococcus pyogenes]